MLPGMVGFYEPEWPAPLGGFSRDARVYEVADGLSPAGTFNLDGRGLRGIISMFTRATDTK